CTHLTQCPKLLVRITLSLLEQQLKEHGIEQIKLRVAYHNERALKLYQAVGFSITGFNMSKKIGAVEA
ncbi:GNAT family N-acetyltransferase, partial [Vibrio tasmaniensis]|uniref:GNAT family N-acetyltransferase n=2 Tax=Vibrio TaxID=662 RepID=UPI0004929079